MRTVKAQKILDFFLLCFITGFFRWRFFAVGSQTGEVFFKQLLDARHFLQKQRKQKRYEKKFFQNGSANVALRFKAPKLGR
ncbi:MAG: hypothetical protein JWP88_2172 [Flaviaesturariibacter sp.]|nr:hypothetical protein [Flaviaesturariibacter sp.]